MRRAPWVVMVVVVVLGPLAGCSSTAGFYDQLSTAAGDVASASGTAAQAIQQADRGRLTSAVRDAAIGDADKQTSSAAGTLGQLRAATPERQAARQRTAQAIHDALVTLGQADDAAANHDDRTLTTLAPTLRRQSKELADLQDEWADR